MQIHLLSYKYSANIMAATNNSSGDCKKEQEDGQEVAFDQTQIQEGSPSKAQSKQMKKVRRSKKDIPSYTWTTEATQQVADFIKERPQLYDKRQKEWLNVAAKARLWTQAAAQLDPPATGLYFFQY